MGNLKKALAEEGVRPNKENPGPADPGIWTKKIPVKRLMSRLSISKYDRDAPLLPFTVKVPQLSIPLKMHIGAPCKAAVEKGAAIKKGMVIGIPQGLGALIHAPVNGMVAGITSETVVIRSE
jgi:hypothetical protein